MGLVVQVPSCNTLTLKPATEPSMIASRPKIGDVGSKIRCQVWSVTVSGITTR